MTKRALTILNENGDSTLLCTEEQDDVMAALIAKKMAEGVTFFIITPRFGGFLPSKKTRLTDVAEAIKHRALSIPDEDFIKFVDSGAGELVKTPEAPVIGTRLSRDPEEVAKSESVAVAPRRGG